MWRVGIVLLLLGSAVCVTLAESEHRTKAALEKVADLFCYKCDTIVDEPRCLNIVDNNTIEKCDKEFRICQVQTITMTTTLEDKSQQHQLWLLKRSCAKICEPVCVTIGERTKLRACNTCCETSYCNTGNGGGALVMRTAMLLLVVVAIIAGQFFDDAKRDYSQKY